MRHSLSQLDAAATAHVGFRPLSFLPDISVASGRVCAVRPMEVVPAFSGMVRGRVSDAPATGLTSSSDHIAAQGRAG